MPPADPTLLSRRAEFIAALRAIVPGEGVIESAAELSAYECDGLTAYHQHPLAVVLPADTAQVSQVLAYCHSVGLKVVARGAGTSLSGGALPIEDAIVLGLSRLNRILEVDFPNRCVVAQPGVTNLAITHAVVGEGMYYAPDPSSQVACSIGGNVAENSGGVHCLKYGMTTNNVLGVECVLIDGTVLRIGGKTLEPAGLDLLGILNGSEGLLAVITEVTVRILPRPATQRALLIGFDRIEEAGACVAAVIAAGIIPAGMEIMDGLATEAAENFVHVGYPLGIAALLIVELDGPPAEVDHLIEEVGRIAKGCGARTLKASNSEAERALIWAGRKAAFSAVGRLAADFYCMDGTIPRRTLPAVLERIEQLSIQYGLRCANVFHAGDGNLHPLILYDVNREGQLETAEAFGADILKLCVEVGGVLTGEHGVGVEKRDLMEVQFGPADLEQQQRLKCAFDEHGLLNPGKVFPQLCRCAELGRVHVHGGAMRRPDLPRF